MRAQRVGFTLAEVIVSIGILAGIFLVVATLLATLLRGTQKTTDETAGALLADQIITTRLQRIFSGSEPGLTKTDFFNDDSPPTAPLQGTVSLNNAIYTYEITHHTLTDTAGVVIGGSLPDNRIKKVNAVVWWWNPDANDARVGYGYLRTETTRLINEKATFGV